MKAKPLQIDTVHQCNCCLGCQTLHPLVSAIDLSQANLTDPLIRFNFYTILLLENKCTDFIYGRQSHDYSNATLLFLPPGQSVEMDTKKPLPKNGWLLAFHPHLLCGTTLATHIDDYSFFSYSADEALHLSQREMTKATECLSAIEQELRHAIDRHSQTIISRYIELFLDYCSRFYERQFITRCEVNKRLLSQLDTLLDAYIRSGQLAIHPQPSADYCAGKLHLSSRYFTDLLHFETGKSIDLYFQLKRMEVAKELLRDKNNDIVQISRLLGFPSVPYFSKLFKKLTGMTPNEHRGVN